jgi:hypothetical protein
MKDRILLLQGALIYQLTLDVGADGVLYPEYPNRNEICNEIFTHAEYI